MVHTPVHASWLNQIEIYFSIVQRSSLAQRLHRLSTRSSTAYPASRPATTRQPDRSNGKFTTTDLVNLLDLLDQHQPSQAGNPAQPRAA